MAQNCNTIKNRKGGILCRKNWNKEAAILRAIQAVSKYVLENEAEFIDQLKVVWNEHQARASDNGQQELAEAKKRIVRLIRQTILDVARKRPRRHLYITIPIAAVTLAVFAHLLGIAVVVRRRLAGRGLRVLLDLAHDTLIIMKLVALAFRDHMAADRLFQVA